MTGLIVFGGAAVSIVVIMMIINGDVDHDDWLYYFKKIPSVGKPLGNLDDIENAELFEMAQKAKARKSAATKSLADAVLEGRTGQRYREQIRNLSKTLNQLNRELKKRGAERP